MEKLRIFEAAALGPMVSSTVSATVVANLVYSSATTHVLLDNTGHSAECCKQTEMNV